jgi:hypothetical protein
LEIGFFLYESNWWLFLGGRSVQAAVGYYPSSIYKGGQMSKNATDLDYGGETEATNDWPQMGSGAFADTSWQHAAFDFDIYYLPNTSIGLPVALNANQPTPKCYTISILSGPEPWNEYFYFGGPGGKGC